MESAVHAVRQAYRLSQQQADLIRRVWHLESHALTAERTHSLLMMRRQTELVF
jgi:hypothetical protein